MTQSLIKTLNQDKANKPIIHALVSQAKLAIVQLENSIELNKNIDFERRLVRVICSWYRIAPNLHIKFPDNFIESAILGYCGETINDTFEHLGLYADLEMASGLKKWLYE